MSWFDNSFSFARTALSQAQKSIDKVLDISEGEVGIHEPTEQEPPGVITSTSSTPVPENLKPSSKFSTSTPKLSGNINANHVPSSLTSTPVTTAAAVSPSQDSFTSTWGGADSLWRSRTNTPSKAIEDEKHVTPGKKPISTDIKPISPVSKPISPVGSPVSKPVSPVGSPVSKPVSPVNKPVSSDNQPLPDRPVNVKQDKEVRTSEKGATPHDKTPSSSSSSTRRVNARRERKRQSSQNTESKGSPSNLRSLTMTSTTNKIQSSVNETDGGVERLNSAVCDTHTTSEEGDTNSSTRIMPHIVPTTKHKDTSTHSVVLRESDDRANSVTNTPTDVASSSTWGVPSSESGLTHVQPSQHSIVTRDDTVITAAEEMNVELVVPSDTTSDCDQTQNNDRDTALSSITVSPLLSDNTQIPTHPSNTDSQRQLLTGDKATFYEVSLSQSHHDSIISVASTESGDILPPTLDIHVPSSTEHHPPTTTTNLPSPLSTTSLLPTSHSSSPTSPTPTTTTATATTATTTTEHTNTRTSKSTANTVEETSSSSLHQSPDHPDKQQHREKKVEGEAGGGGYGKEGDGMTSTSAVEEIVIPHTGTRVDVVVGNVEKTGEGGDEVNKSSGESVTGAGLDVEAIQQELIQVKKVLEARETRMLEMSREMIEMNEANQDLQSRLSSAEQDLCTSHGGVDELRSEFTKRLGTTEKKLQTISKERDSLKKQLQVLVTEQTQQRKSASQELSALLKEKEEQITGLLKEGETLSKKELQNSNIIKRLKEKNKQNDQLLTAQRQLIEDCEREVSRLKEVIKKKEENEKKYQESLAQLNSIAEQQEKELTAIKAERDDLIDKVRSLQANLDSAYKELSELHKVTAVNKSAAHEALLSAEQTARQELTEVLEKQRVESHREKEKLLLEISELRASVSRCEQQAAWREERMKQEVSDIQQRLQEAEMRNQELTTTISQTTKPFLRQIETLHSAHSTQTASWEKVEANLTHRLVEAQSQLTAAVEKERSSTEKALTLQSRVTQLEKQTASLRQEKSRLTAALELEKAKAETFEEGQQRDSAKMEAVRASLQQSLEDVRKEKEMLERQLEYERVRLEAESRKACLESQEKERLRSQLASSLSRGLSRQSSTASTPYSQSEILEKSLVQEMSESGVRGGVRGGGSMSTMDVSFYHGRAHPTSASAIEQLQSLLKQKEGELANAQTLVGSLERSRAAMANDLAAVSTQNVELTDQVNTIPHLNNKLQELQKNNEALLQMYGEKAEETEELKLDIQDVKEMYRQQIDDLTKR